MEVGATTGGHLHISAMHAFLTFLSLLAFFFFWHLIAYSNADKVWGQAMTFII